MALTTLGVGAFGIQRMSVLSDQAQTVYDEGTVPVNALRQLQADWWQLSTHTARANIQTLPPASRLSAQQKAAEMAGTLSEDTATVAEMPLSDDARVAFDQFTEATADYLGLLAKLQGMAGAAARAGEAGKGFAVVASEVKELAQETARATEDISSRVEAIQADTAGAVEAISQISAVIGEINDFQATIAAAVEEQTATTNEMNRNVAEAASGTQGIAAAISGLAAGTAETNQRVADAQMAAGELARMSRELQDAVSRFTV